MKKVFLLVIAVATLSSCTQKPHQVYLSHDEFEVLKNEIVGKGAPYTNGKISEKGIELIDNHHIYQLSSDSMWIYRKNKINGEETSYYRTGND